MNALTLSDPVFRSASLEFSPVKLFIVRRNTAAPQTYNLIAIGAGTGGLVSAAGSAGVYAKVPLFYSPLSSCRIQLHLLMS